MDPDLTTLANVKAWLGITSGNSDTVLQRLVTAQSEWFRQQTEVRITRNTYTVAFSGNDERVVQKAYQDFWSAGFFGGFNVGARGYAIVLPRYPVLPFKADGVTDSISVVIDGGDGTGALTPVPKATNMGQPTQTDGWVLHEDTGQIELLGYRFTLGVANNVITYDAGYDPVPADVEQAIIELVAWKFKERDHIGQASKLVGGEQVTFNPYPAPMSVQAVIDNYRRINI